MQEQAGTEGNKQALKETRRLRREQAGYEGNKQALKETSRQ